MDCLISRILLQKVSSYKYYFYTKAKYVFKAGPSRLYDGWAKSKEIVPDALDPNQNVQAT